LGQEEGAKIAVRLGGCQAEVKGGGLMALHARRKTRRKESESAGTVNGRKSSSNSFRPFRRPLRRHYSALTLVETNQYECAEQCDIEKDQECCQRLFVPLELFFADNIHLTPPV
jgi:hypothetical protein